ncbi:MAG: hypothetical protein VBE63_07325 [Lamprobacter sp.]|uniref:hypothetical protein n=1 Tax=Lamprobacter sp. TaxID=3100796 RepID=UPI002B2618E7|nr:hypothetical protein [Lamprobacter sp.]MEA3639739.1 hypothetical protein [Lamprobacter sp.]
MQISGFDLQILYDHIRPEPPQFLRAYQPHLRYDLIDEGRYTAEQLSAIDSPLSGLFQVEIAARDRASLQAAVDRLVRLIQADPNKARLDRLMPGATQTMKELLSRPDGLALTGRP